MRTPAIGFKINDIWRAKPAEAGRCRSRIQPSPILLTAGQTSQQNVIIPIVIPTN
jgi:hypothetical protein